MASESGERADTYLLDPENVAEMARLEIQGHLLTHGMGGPLPELDNRLPQEHPHVLDLGCGPGEWVLHLAQEHPRADVVGVDISRLMVAYAQNKGAQTNILNARFLVGNILEPLDFPDGTFDLVNARFLVSVLQTDRWVEFVRECVRVTKPGGWIRLTEFDNPGQTNKVACQQFADWTIEACRRSGYGFATTPPAQLITPMLEPLLREAGCHGIVQREHTLDFSFGSELYASQRQNYRVAYKQAQPLFVRLGLATSQEIEVAYEEMLAQMQAEDFQGTWSFVTVLGKRP